MDEDAMPTNKAQRAARAQQLAEELRIDGEELHPILPKGQKISKTYWGQTWNRNLESYEVYAHRLPRGRSHLRAGAVIDFRLSAGEIWGRVATEELFEVTIRIDPMDEFQKEKLEDQLRTELSSISDLLTANFSESLMKQVSSMDTGLFPQPSEIRCTCACEDYADLCAHSAALLYACGVHFDENPQDLFYLRQVSPEELMMQSLQSEAEQLPDASGSFEDKHLEDLFGIAFDSEKDKRISEEG